MRISFVALAGPCLIIAAPVAAQIPDSSARIPDLQVTVTRTPATLSRVGASVSIIDSDAIHRQRLATGLDEALEFVPGVVAQNRWNYSSMSASRFADSGRDPTSACAASTCWSTVCRRPSPMARAN